MLRLKVVYVQKSSVPNAWYNAHISKKFPVLEETDEHYIVRVGGLAPVKERGAILKKDAREDGYIKNTIARVRSNR